MDKKRRSQDSDTWEAQKLTQIKMQENDIFSKC